MISKLEHNDFSPSEVVQISKDAAAKILGVYSQTDISFRSKDDNSPVTDADHKSHDLILSRLSAHTPDIPIISEEDGVGGRSPVEIMKNEKQFWLVDPLDGTKGFINRTDEFCVCISLIENGEATAGFIFDPVGGISYSAIVGLGAFRQEKQVSERIQVRRPPQQISVFMSKNHKGGEAEIVDRVWPQTEKYHESSALKFCHIASGKADVYFRTNPTCLWDTAAGQAIVSAAGGQVVTFDGKPMRYIRDGIINPGFVVSSSQALTDSLLAGIVNAGID